MNSVLAVGGGMASGFRMIQNTSRLILPHNQLSQVQMTPLSKCIMLATTKKKAIFF